MSFGRASYGLVPYGLAPTTTSSTPTGTGAATMPSVVGAASGVHGVAGTAAATFPSLTGSSVGVVGGAGTAAGTLPSLAASASGAHGVASTAAATFPSLTASGAGAHGVAGTGQAALPSLVAAGAGSFGQDSFAAGVFPSLQGLATSVHGVSGTAAAVLPSLVAAASDAAVVVITGIGNAVLPRLQAAAAGLYVFSRVHQRNKIRDAVVAMLTGVTAAGARVYPSRFLPWFPSEVPAISVYTLETRTASGSQSTAPRMLEHEVEVVVEAVVEAGSGENVNTPNPVSAEDKCDDIAAEIESTMAGDMRLRLTANDSWLTSSTLEEIQIRDSSFAVIRLMFTALYERGYPNEDDLLIIDEFRKADIRYRSNGVAASDEAADLLEDI